MADKNTKIIVLGSIFVAAIIAAGAIFGAKIFNNDKNENFVLNLSSEELAKRTDKSYLIDINLLDENSPEYTQLNDKDKEALKHLVRAAEILQKIH